MTEDVAVRFGFHYVARLTVDDTAECTRFADVPGVR